MSIRDKVWHCFGQTSMAGPLPCLIVRQRSCPEDASCDWHAISKSSELKHSPTKLGHGPDQWSAHHGRPTLAQASRQAISCVSSVAFFPNGAGRPCTDAFRRAAHCSAWRNASPSGPNWSNRGMTRLIMADLLAPGANYAEA